MFNDLTTATLIAAMRGGMARQQVLSQNIANADTPGYKRLDVSFEGALADAVSSDRAATSSGRGAVGSGTQWWDRPSGLRHAGTSSLQTAGVTPATTRDDTTTVRADGSNVDADNEMAELASNQLAYNTATDLLAARFAQMRTAITGS